MAENKYKLYYFDVRGVAEPIRLLFAYAGKPFEDARHTREDWPQLKQKFFFGKVPVLEVTTPSGEVKQLGQSMTIARYLGEAFGAAGKDPFEKAKVDEALDFVKDFQQEVAPFVYAKMGFRPGNVEELQKTVFEPAFQAFAPQFTRLIEQSGSGFVVPSGPTFTDFFVADFFFTLKSQVPELFGQFPALGAYVDRVYGANEGVRKYVASRKV